MKLSKQHSGFAIALAWPETYCKQPGAWYDGLMYRLGISKNHYYKVGHAALVLIDAEQQKCHYFDFGRYHAPFKHGRVRSASTDFELEMKTTPIISDDGKSIKNYIKILEELQNNHACHGEGTLHASYCSVNFEAACRKAKQLQVNSPIPYGPFKYKGSNCSRFVNTVIRAGEPHWSYRSMLNYLVVLTPTPMNNVVHLEDYVVLPKLLKTKAFEPIKPLSKQQQKSVLLSPEKHKNIPITAKWLGGEGAGSWFDVSQHGSKLKVVRYSPDGIVECEGVFAKMDNEHVILNKDFRLSYPSNCAKLTLINNGQRIFFNRLDKKTESIKKGQIAGGA